ncbi:MAG: ComF family protein [Kiritimatiellae bacterium]|nr:ComF family protein [Kiritimatiellia bacterium]
MKLTNVLHNSIKGIANFYHTLGDLVTPRHCVSCGAASGNSYLCAACKDTIILRPTTGCCKICGNLPSSGSHGFMYCSSCLANRPTYDIARSATIYEGAVRDMILALKYKQGTYLVKDLAALVEGCVRASYSDEQIDAICPIPLYPTKERERGYNQAALIAKELSKNLGVPYMPQLLERVRHTFTQTKLNSEQRKENVHGAFNSSNTVADYVYGRNILLVDDVFTTGATCSECASVLKRNHAGKVFVVSIAREQ